MKKNSNYKYLDIINNELHRINKIIIDYQDNNTRYEMFNLYELFNDIKSTLNSLYNNKNIYLNIECNKDLVIFGNYNQLKQVFINIFKNAEEAKDKNILLIKVVVIKLKESLKIIITDNGKGMNKEELERIKEEYYTTKDNGTGLGVPFILDIIKRHNGSIKYKSCETKGTTITMKLPVLTN